MSSENNLVIATSQSLQPRLSASARKRVFLPSIKHAVIEDFDRILFLSGATVAAVAEHAWQFRVGAIAIALMVAPKLLGSYQRAVKIYREKHLPVVLGICTDDEFRNMTEDALEAARPYGFDEAAYAKDYAVLRQDLTYHREDELSDDPEVWRLVALREKRRISSLQSKIAGKKTFHFFLRCPSALGIGIGAALGTKHELICHHHQPGAGPLDYLPLIDVTCAGTPDGVRVLKSRVSTFQYLDIKDADKATNIVYVALFLAGHDPRGNVQDLAAANSASVVEIVSRFPAGTIPPDADWILIAREIVTVLLQLMERREVKEVHLFPSIPVCLAFAVGMGLDNRAPFTIHHWFAKLRQYKPVLQLNELRD